MSKHTPGPWGYFRHYPEGTWHIAASPMNYTKGQHCIADVDTEDNARLMHAAPELLEALKKARRFVLLSQEPVGAELDEIDAAVKKATGESPC